MCSQWFIHALRTAYVLFWILKMMCSVVDPKDDPKLISGKNKFKEVSLVACWYMINQKKENHKLLFKSKCTDNWQSLTYCILFLSDRVSNIINFTLLINLIVTTQFRTNWANEKTFPWLINIPCLKKKTFVIIVLILIMHCTLSHVMCIFCFCWLSCQPLHYQYWWTLVFCS